MSIHHAGSPNYRRLRTILCLLVFLGFIWPLQSSQAQNAPTIEDQIHSYLATHPLITSAGAVVLSVRLNGEALIIDLSREILPEGPFDESNLIQLEADLDDAFQINAWFLMTFKIEGQPLEHWGRPVPDFTETVSLPSVQELPGSGPLAGVRVALSPGHGLYWNEFYGDWRYQRFDFYGIREDTLNAEIMAYVQTALQNQGATVIQLRELDFLARTGVTGYPAWHEGARQYSIYRGLPSWIWSGGSTNYNSDIRARPYMANYFGADMLISLHNNGTPSYLDPLTGTETYYDTDNHPGSRALASAVHNRIIDAIRNDYGYSAWFNRGLKASDSDYGEINYAQMPAALVELAFMDRQYPDNAFLQKEAFKQTAANAIVQGICDYRGVSCPLRDPLEPVVIEAPALTPPFGTGMCDSGWRRFVNSRGQQAYLTLNTASEDQRDHVATWQPTLPVSGTYRIEAFIPATAPVNWRCPELLISKYTRQAIYTVRHTNGESSVLVQQALHADQWADLGLFHFDSETLPHVQLSDFTHETYQSRLVSASAMRFTPVGSIDQAFRNTEWLEEGWTTANPAVPAEHLRHFFNLNQSCLAAPFLDADGVEIDLPDLIRAAAADHAIDPRLLLTIMEAEQHALTSCPDADALSRLMGLEPASTARAQIGAAAQYLGSAVNIQTTTGATPQGWRAGISKATLDGVMVTPANADVALLFDWNQHAGTLWGGSEPDVGGVAALYAAYAHYHLDRRLPQAVHTTYLTTFLWH